jgi:hypothetical protein
MVGDAVHQGIFNTKSVSKEGDTFTQNSVPARETRQANPKFSDVSQINQGHHEKDAMHAYVDKVIINRLGIFRW